MFDIMSLFHLALKKVKELYLPTVLLSSRLRNGPQRSNMGGKEKRMIYINYKTCYNKSKFH